MSVDHPPLFEKLEHNPWFNDNHLNKGILPARYGQGTGRRRPRSANVPLQRPSAVRLSEWDLGI